MKRIAFVLAAVGLWALVAAAQDPAAPAANEAKAEKAGHRWGAWLGLNLTAEQKAKIAEARQNAREKIAGILSDEQKAKVQAAREKIAEALQGLRPNLTDEQKAKIKEIVQAARTKAAAAPTAQEKIQIALAAKEEAAKVLTEEQLQKVAALKARFGALRGIVHRWRARQSEQTHTAPAQ